MAVDGADKRDEAKRKAKEREDEERLSKLPEVEHPTPGQPATRFG